MFIPHGFRNITALTRKLRFNDEHYWMKRGDIMVLKLFHDAAKRVPAYKDYLRKNKIIASKIKSIEDFKKVPTIDKNNYLRKYPLESLCWDGKFNEKAWTISTTSGSTGEPYYFPRNIDQDWQYAIMAEMYLRTNFDIHKKSTLYIVGFPMGAWIGGLFTYHALELLRKNSDYNLSIITPGISKQGIIDAIKKLGDKFDQVIIGSYGPFLKDTLDDGIRMGVDWKKYNLGFIFSAEGFTEGFRDYVLKISGSKNIYKATLNHYGTVDLGTMSYETPISILSRRLATKNDPLYKDIFGEVVKLPTLTQYIPEMFYFEDIDGNLLCSGYSGLPLVRYDLKDRGGVISYSELSDIYKNRKINLLREAKKVDIGDTIWKLPYVYVYERSDFSVSFYSFQIYPETIRRALQVKELEKLVTGKFTMLVDFDKNLNQYFEVNIELMSGVGKFKKLEVTLQQHILRQLLLESSEYNETYKSKKELVLPKVVLWKYENLKYFKPGIKQKWVKK